MFWQEKTSDKPYVVPDDVVDLAFRIKCKTLPLEHAHALSKALHEPLPWLELEEEAGIHLIHGAESGNGWMRPEDPESELLHLSRRTRMTLRLPKHRIEDARALTGQVLDVAGHPLEVGEGAVRPLVATTTIFARYVIAASGGDEEAFLQDAAKQLGELGIEARKMLCGKSHVLRTPEGKLFTRSLMVADLDVPDAVKLQQTGLGPGRKIGCGLFIPHKGIAPVTSSDDE
jgi:CRISPR-associated protein Cas6